MIYSLALQRMSQCAGRTCRMAAFAHLARPSAAFWARATWKLTGFLSGAVSHPFTADIGTALFCFVGCDVASGECLRLGVSDAEACVSDTSEATSRGRASPGWRLYEGFTQLYRYMQLIWYEINFN